MKSLKTLLKRFCMPYRGRMVKSILFNLLSALFGTLSIVMLIPILGILFGTNEMVYDPGTFDMGHLTSSIKNHMAYMITYCIESFGGTNTLLIIGGFAVFTTALKTGFMFLASRELINIRNGVVRDIRKKIYKKILALPIPFFSEERKGDMIARMTTDVQEVEASVM